VARDEAEHAAGPQGVQGLREEKVVEREPLALVLDFEVGERGFPTTASWLPSGSFVSRKLSMRMSCSGKRARAIRPESESSSTPVNRIPAGASRRKLPEPQPGSSTRASQGTPRRARASNIALTTVGEV
jgi:hypothetical protein